MRLTEAAVTRAHAKARGETFPEMPTVLTASEVVQNDVISRAAMQAVRAGL